MILKRCVKIVYVHSQWVAGHGGNRKHRIQLPCNHHSFKQGFQKKAIFAPVTEMYQYVVPVSSPTRKDDDNNVKKHLSVHMDL